MRYLSLFSGIEACTVAWHQLGWEPVAFCEFDKFPSAVLAHHYPDVTNLGDVTQITDEDIKALGHIDIVVGGSPCQDLSVAGKRGGLAGARSGLFHEQMRIFNAARSICGARYLLWENVPGAFSSNQGKDFAVVVGAMAGCKPSLEKGQRWQNTGVALGENGLLEWSTMDAQFFGVPQRRRRVFALLDTGDWAGRPPILFEPESLRRDPAPSREKGQGASGYTGAGIETVSKCLKSNTGGIDREDCHTLIPEGFRMQAFGEYSNDETGSAMKMRDYKDATDLIVEPIPIHDQATRHSGKRDDKSDGKGNGLDAGKEGDACPTLTSGDKHAICIQGSMIGRADEHGPQDDGINKEVSFTINTTDKHAVAFEPGIMKREGNDNRVSDEVVPTLRSDMGDNQPAVAFTQNQRDEVRTMEVAGAIAAEPGMKQQTFIAFNARQDPDVSGDITGPLNGQSPQNQAVQSNMVVRRLTPIECSRLQNFPDDYLELKYADADEAHAAQILHTLWREVGAKEIKKQERTGIITSLLTPQILLTGVYVGWIHWKACERYCEHQRSSIQGESSFTEGFMREVREAGKARRSPYQRESYRKFARESYDGLPVMPYEIAQAREVLRCSELWEEAQRAWPLRYAFATEKERESGKNLTPDGPRYKALGNSMAVPCMFWIGRRISEAING